MTPEQKVWMTIYAAVMNGLAPKLQNGQWEDARERSTHEANKAVEEFRRVNK